MFEFHKASFSKRFGAGMFDLILLVILSVGFLLLFNSVTGYDEVYSRYQNTLEKYQREYGVVFDISSEEYESMSEQEKSNWEDAYNSLVSESTVIENYDKLIKLSLLNITASIVISYLILEFGVTFIFKNGQTVGKKLFGICLMSPNQVKVRPVQVFTRVVIGKFTVETMIPGFCVVLLFFNEVSAIPVLLSIVIALVEVILFFTSKGSRLLHDVFAQTVVVDYSTQTIFENYDLMIKAKNEYHERMVEKTEY